MILKLNFFSLVLKFSNLVLMFTSLTHAETFYGYNGCIMNTSYGNSTVCVGWQGRVGKGKCI